jgi:hypothetical protein
MLVKREIEYWRNEFLLQEKLNCLGIFLLGLSVSSGSETPPFVWEQRVRKVISCNSLFSVVKSNLTLEAYSSFQLDRKLLFHNVTQSVGLWRVKQFYLILLYLQISNCFSYADVLAVVACTVKPCEMTGGHQRSSKSSP